MNSRERTLAALARKPVDRPPVIGPTSLATVALMDMASAPLPAAHHDPELMARLAATSYTDLGFDSVMPVFSVVQETSALGFPIHWGAKDVFPAADPHARHWTHPGEIAIPMDFLGHQDSRCVLEAIRILKHQFGGEVAIIGKAMGPWTLAYHTFGLENFLIMAAEAPETARDVLVRLKEVTVEFGLAQIEAGADVLCIPDHATGDLVSAKYYATFLRDLHAELVGRLPVPLILHICGKTMDRMDHIASTGMAGFHFDSKNDTARSLAAVRDRLALIGNLNNPAILLHGKPGDVRREVFAALEAGVPIIAPECAIPLTTPLENLQEIPKAVKAWRNGSRPTN